MKKEIIIAIFFGLLFGGILVGGIWVANQAVQNNSNSLVSANATPNSNQAEKKDTSLIPLSILSPFDLTLVNRPQITLEGKTLSNSHLIIQTETTDSYLKSDDQGTFSEVVSLSSGSNDLSVTVITDTGDTSTKTITIVYSTAVI